MATALEITSSKIGNDVFYGVALGEEIDYTITATDPVVGDQCDVYVRKSHNDSAVLTRRVTLNTIGSGTTSYFRNTWELYTSRGLELDDDITDGSYYLYTELVGNTSVNATSSGTFDIVLISPWMLENVYLAGVPFKDYSNVDLNDQMAIMCIETAIDEVEREIQIFLYQKNVVCGPDGDDTYDVAAKRISYHKRDMKAVGFINLPHFWVQDVTELKGYLANQVAITFPIAWLQIKKKRGTVYIVPSTATNASVTGTIGTAMLVGNTAVDLIPGWWKVKYTAGWNENIDGHYPKELLKIIGMKATLNAVPILSDSLKPGVSSTSISFDNLSETQGTTASAIYALLSARENTYKKQYDSGIKSFIRKYRGPVLTVY